MGNCRSSSKVVCQDRGSSWIMFQDDNGDHYWFNFETGNSTYEEQQCDWVCDVETNIYGDLWRNVVTGEMRPSPPTAISVGEAAILQALTSLAEASSAGQLPSVPVATAVAVSHTDASL